MLVEICTKCELSEVGKAEGMRRERRGMLNVSGRVRDLVEEGIVVVLGSSSTYCGANDVSSSPSVFLLKKRGKKKRKRKGLEWAPPLFPPLLCIPESIDSVFYPRGNLVQ